MTLANKITMARILLVPFFVTCFIYYSPEADFLRYIALVIFAVSVMTDAVDGYVARKYYQKTKLGTALDPIADKLLLVSAYISLTLTNTLPASSRLPPWVTVVVISRDVLIVLGTMMLHMLMGKIEIRPNILGKITTALQMFTVIVVLLGYKYSYIIWITTVIFTVLSGLAYLIRANRLQNVS
ncbi:MAG: CDP-alcohol phosphatidyltransferase family protein [Candidatus Omnitrophica bacterium]|nr:CDP-alcohol phosphatidyltransferase family protein [Candidatus Omnitrophota bacterium]